MKRTVSANMEDGIDRILAGSLESAGDLQPWPGYFRAKAEELRTISRFYNFEDARSVLEIGCGNAFLSAIFSTVASRVVASDLPEKVPASHSPGIDAARSFLKRLGIDNVETVAGSAEALPFPDKDFDLVFSAYAVQYVRDKEKALREIRRVLKDNGAAVIIVPNFTERVFAPVMKYEQLLLGAVREMSRRLADKGKKGDRPGKFARSRLARSSGAGLWDRVALRPDGHYKSFVEETFRHTPLSWRRLFSANGFEVRRTFSTELFPLGIFEVFSLPMRRLIARQASRLSRRLGGLPGIKNVGYSFGMVVVKV